MPIRVLIIDDSLTMRKIIRHIFEADPEIEVVGEAGDPYEARAAIKALAPDVLTLDVEMPRMDGVEFLQKIMTLRPMPVIMVSTLTQKSADRTMRALEIGAVDFVAKPSGQNMLQDLAILVPKVKAASRARLTPQLKRLPPPDAPSKDKRYTGSSRSVIAIGASTGGVDALLQIISHFPKNCPPTLIVQHMPAKFTSSFAARLNNCTDAHVMEAEHGMVLRKGHIYLAPGGDRHLRLIHEPEMRCALVRSGPVNGHCPSIDTLFHSVSKLGKRAGGVLLTGMGSDGASGLKQIRNVGGWTFGQDKRSCVVYGMPRVAQEIGAVERQLPLGSIGPAILEECYAPA